MGVERAADSFRSGFQLLALAATADIRREQLFEVRAFERFVSLTDCFISLLRNISGGAGSLTGRGGLLQFFRALSVSNPAKIVECRRLQSGNLAGKGALEHSLGFAELARLQFLSACVEEFAGR